MTHLVSRLIACEADIRYQEPATEEEPEFAYLEGRIPVLVSAPHGAVQTRNSKPKDEDEFTAGLARLIGQVTGAHVLYARRKSATDPNWHANAPFKSKLQEVVKGSDIQFVLDLHGASEKRAFGMAVGTMGGKSCRDRLSAILRTLRTYGFSREAQDPLDRVDVDGQFTGTGRGEQQTITRFVWERLGVSAAQFELNASLRIPKRRTDATQKDPFEGDRHRILRAIRALSDVVRIVCGQTKGCCVVLGPWLRIAHGGLRAIGPVHQRVRCAARVRSRCVLDGGRQSVLRQVSFHAMLRPHLGPAGPLSTRGLILDHCRSGVATAFEAPITTAKALEGDSVQTSHP